MAKIYFWAKLPKMMDGKVKIFCSVRNVFKTDILDIQITPADILSSN